MTAVTLNGAAVTHQDSNKTGAASGAALSSYYISASNRNEQSVELAITAEKGYYVSRIVVACIDPHGQSPYSCKTWSAGNAYDVPFSLARSVKQNDGTFKLSIPLNSKNFCHSSNSNGNHGYYILIQVAPIPKPVYVEYDYGNVLTLCGNNAKLAEALNNSAWWTTEGSDNAYGIGAGKFVANTKFEYNCEATTITINGQTTQEIVLENMAEGHVEITNRYAEQKPQNGKLTITKSFRGVYAYDLPRSFTVYVRPMNEDGMTLGSAMAVVLNRNSDNTYSATIEVGYNVYEVTEQNPNLSGYVFTGANYSAVSTGRDVAGYDLPRTNGIYVSTGENGTASVAVTNSYYYDYHDYVPVIPPAKPLPPQTGDSGTAYMGIALCVMAAAAFVAARSRKRS